MPSLRDRREDVPLLAAHFVAKFRYYNRPARGFSPAALAALTQYNWPGNVRELQNVVEHAVGKCASEWIEPEDLIANVTQAAAIKAPLGGYEARVLTFKKELLERTLRETNGSLAEAARSLSITLRHLYRVARRLGVELE